MKRIATNDWKRIRTIFDDALGHSAEDRGEFVRSACGDDEALRLEVESLLESLDGAELFLETPAVVKVVEDSLDNEQQLTQGEMLLHYRIGDLLGSGGMGEVYLARDTRLNRNVAIKVLRASFVPDAQAGRRLLREARAAALLEHPNICQIYEIAESGGHNFIVMQYLVGRTLAEILGERSIRIAESLDIAIQVAEGLAEAHGHGIVHRDIKPANVIVSDKGQVKILDFGLAKFIEADSDAETSVRLNTSGAVMGTVPFMSPEQLRGGFVDARSDVFSVGSLLYEILAGKPAFNRDNNAETISSILNEEPDWSAVPNAVRPVLKKCLEKDVRERYRSAADLAKDLAAVRSSDLSDEIVGTETAETRQPETGETSSNKKRHLYFWQSDDQVEGAQVADAPSTGQVSGPSFGIAALTALAALGVIVVASASVWYWQSTRTLATNFDTLKPVQLVSWKSGATTNPTDFRVSADGTMVAYSSSQTGSNESIYIKQTSDGKEFQVTKDEWANVSPLWSPDNQRIAFVSLRQDQSGIYVVPFLGGAVSQLKLTGQPNISLRYWSHDGSAIYYDHAGNLYRLDLRTSDVSQVTDLAPTAGVSNRFFAVSPDESRIAFCDTRDGQKDIFTIPLRGGEESRITNDADAERRPVWDPDGQRLFYNVTINDFIQINVVAADGKGQTMPLTRGEGKYSLIDIAPDGRRMYYSTTTPRSDVASVDVQTGREDELAAESDTEMWTDVSPDGKSILYLTNSSPNPNGRISSSSLLIKSEDGQNRLLPSKGFDARWLPDSRRISFFRQNEKSKNDFDGVILDTVTGSESQLTAEAVMPPPYSPMPIARVGLGTYDISPDSKRVTYLDLKTPQNVKVSDIGSDVASSLTKNEDPNVSYSSPKFSPDGKRIAFVSLERSQDQAQKPIGRVHVAEADRVQELYSTTDAMRLIGWSATGSLIVATARRPFISPLDVEITSISLAGVTSNISTLASTYGRTIVISPDGNAIAYTVNHEDRDDIWMTSLLPGSKPRQVTSNDATRQFLTNLEFTPDGKKIFFDKQEEINTISVFENFN